MRAEYKLWIYNLVKLIVVTVLSVYMLIFLKDNETSIRSYQADQKADTVKGETDEQTMDNIRKKSKGKTKDASIDGAASPDDFTIDTSAGYAVITEYHGSAQKLVIPNVIDGYHVAVINPWVFEENTQLKQVILPDSVWEVGEGAFSNCKKLSRVQATTALTTIQPQAFKECPALEKLVFQQADGKEYGLSFIGHDAFLDCKSLKGFDFGEATVFLRLEIEGNAFAGCKSISSMKLPANTKVIGDSAFSECSNLKKVTFQKGSKLQEDEFGAQIESFAFQKTAVSKINVPGNYTRIGNGAFEDCKNLTEFRLQGSGSKEPDQCINFEAFNGDSALKKIYLPDTFLADEMGFPDMSGVDYTIYAKKPEAVKEFTDEYSIKCVKWKGKSD